MNKSLKIWKYTMIASWAFTIIGIILYACMFTYFHIQGYTTDEDIMESGIAEGWWQNIIFICFSLSYLISFPIGIISTIFYLIISCRKSKLTHSKEL
jgi:hypothetical protein